jgi:GC-rich sequence DNA-binding factor
LLEVVARVASHTNRLDQDERRVVRELSTYTVQKEQNDNKCKEFTQSLAIASKRHNFFAKLRVFIVDVTACLSEKRPMILDLIAAQNKIRKETFELLQVQRHYDVEDAIRTVQEAIQNNDSSGAVEICQATTHTSQLVPCASVSSSSSTQPEQVDEFGRNINSAETLTGVQIARAQAREQRWKEYQSSSNSNSNSNSSTTENATHHPWNALNGNTINRALQREKGVHDASVILFDDVRQDLRNTTELIHMFQRWSMEFESDFKMTFGALSMPEIFEWYSRVALLRWNPLSTSKSSADQYLSVASILEWTTTPPTTAAAAAAAAAPPRQWSRTVSLVQSSLVKSCIVPHVQFHVEQVWDIGILAQTMNLNHVLFQLKGNFNVLASDADWIGDSASVYQQLVSSVVERLQTEVAALQIPVVRVKHPGKGTAVQIDRMEQHLITNQVLRAVKIGLSIVLCSSLMSATTCNDLVFHKIVQRLLVPALANENDFSHTVAIQELLSSFETHTPMNATMQQLFQQFKSCLRK